MALLFLYISAPSSEHVHQCVQVYALQICGGYVYLENRELESENGIFTDQLSVFPDIVTGFFFFGPTLLASL